MQTLNKAIGRHLIGLVSVALVFLPESVFAKSDPISPPLQPADAWQETWPATPHAPWQAEAPPAPWWKQFQDDALSAYIQTALQNNPDLTMATLRIDEVAESVRQAQAGFFPTITADANATRQRNSATLRTPNLQQATGVGQTGIFRPGQALNIYSFPLRGNYTVDYLGRTRDRVWAARKQLEATRFSRDRLRQTLAANVALAYFNLVRTDRLLHLQQRLEETLSDTIALQADQTRAGLRDHDGVLAAEQALNQALAETRALCAEQAVYAHALRVLTGQSPTTAESLPRVTAPDPPIPIPAITPVPATVLAEHPDIRATEATLAQAHLNVSAARKALFPTLTLTGQYGFASTRLNQVFQWDSVVRAISGGLSQTLLQGGLRRSQLRQAKVQAEIQLKAYHATILQTLQAVEDQLAVCQGRQAQVAVQADSARGAQTQQNLSQARYDQGLSDYLAVLTAQETALTREKALVHTRLLLASDMVRLYHALGYPTENP